MMNSARRVPFLVLSIFAFSSAFGDGASPADLQDLAARSSMFGGNVKALRATAADLDAAAFTAALEKLEREARAIADDAKDLGVKPLARSLGEAESALKKMRRQVADDEGYFMKELAGDMDSRLETIEGSADALVRDIEKRAAGQE
jgi:hypothetical protein